MQKHIHKCFEAIKRLEFTNNLEVAGIHSGDGEFVEFAKSDWINVNIGENKGNVEKWLCDVEKIMRKTLYDITLKALEDR